MSNNDIERDISWPVEMGYDKSQAGMCYQETKDSEEATINLDSAKK